MEKFRVMVHGENLLMKVDGVRQKVGFFVNVFVEAFTRSEAESQAIELVQEDNHLREIQLNPEHDVLRLSVEEIHEVESFEGRKLPRQGFVFYPPKEV